MTKKELFEAADKAMNDYNYVIELGFPPYYASKVHKEMCALLNEIDEQGLTEEFEWEYIFA